MVNTAGSRLSTRDAPFPHLRSRPLAPYVCGWLQMIIIDGQLYPGKDISNQAPRKEKARAFNKLNYNLFIYLLTFIFYYSSILTPICVLLLLYYYFYFHNIWQGGAQQYNSA